MSYTSLFYHIVFATKERRPFLSDELAPRAIQYIGGIVRNINGRLLAGGGVDDHLHLIVTTRPVTALADFVGTLKANCTGWIHETFPDMRAFAWQDGYAAFSVSRSVLGRTIQYVKTQQEHHRKITFQEELIALLEKHGIEYDKRYVCA